MIHIQLNADEALHRTAESLKQGRKLYGILGEALRTIHKERFTLLPLTPFTNKEPL